MPRIDLPLLVFMVILTKIETYEMDSPVRQKAFMTETNFIHKVL